MPELSYYQKSFLATALLAIACLQFLAIAVGRGWAGGFSVDVRRWAIRFHRFEGYVGFSVMLWVAYNCVFNIGVRLDLPRVAAHSLLGTSVIALVMAKIVVARGLKQHSVRLPALGLTLFAAVVALWLTSAGWYFFTEGVGY